MDNPNPIMYSMESGKYYWLKWKCIYFAHLFMEMNFIMTFHLTNLQPIYSGADGVFAINKTSGCITLKVYPADLRREVFNIKVKVKILF